MQRRQFMAGGLGVFACASMGSAALAASQVAAAGIHANSFVALLHEPFHIFDSARGVRVVLVKVRTMPSTTDLHQFTLSFQGEPSGALPSGTYEVEHAATGKVPMFLQASQRGGQGVLYRADFSLLG